MRLTRNRISMTMVACAVLAAACSSGPHGSGGDSTSLIGSNGESHGAFGTVGLQLQLAPGITLGTVQYAITNPTLAGFTTVTGSVDVSGSQTLSFAVTLPVATGYRISLSAIDSAGDSCAAGPASFDVAAQQTNAVGLTLLCSRTVDSGLFGPDVNVAPVLVTADASLVITTNGAPCAAATVLYASPAATGVGSTISLTGAGLDPSYQSGDVTLTWSSVGSAGSLTSTTGASTTFSCTADGRATITLTASIANGGASCPGTGTLSQIVTCGTRPDATAPEAGPPEAGPEASAPETGTPDAGPVPDAVADVNLGPALPCVGAGDAPNCVQCDHSASGICSGTEAVVVQRDIDKGLYAGTALNAYPGTNPSCYECLVSKHGLDSTISHNHECEDLTGNVPGSATLTNSKGCLDALTCILGNPATGASPWTSCANDPTDGYANCYCGANEPDTTDCSTAQSISAHNTGALGSASPNGVCAEPILVGIGDTDSTSPGQVLTDIGQTTVGSGRALSILGVAGSQIASPACGQCFQ